MTTFFALLGAAGLWVLYELAGQIVGAMLWVVLGPVFTPVGRLAGRLLSGRAVVLLWMLALASYGFLPYSMNASSLAVGILGLVAFMGSTPLALIATFEWRDRGRVLRRGAAYAPSHDAAFGSR